jgi:hypothetical protein
VVLLKYVCIVIRANDHGEGGTFALYSLLCRTIGVSPFGNYKENDHKQLLRMSSSRRLRSSDSARLPEVSQEAAAEACTRWWCVYPLCWERAAPFYNLVPAAVHRNFLAFDASAARL